MIYVLDLVEILFNAGELLALILLSQFWYNLERKL